MGTQDNGSIPFQDFIKRVRLPIKNPPSAEEVARCKKAFEEGTRAASATAEAGQHEKRGAKKRTPKNKKEFPMFELNVG